MAAGDEQRVVHARADLIKDPSSKDEDNYGGTVMGLAKLIAWQIITIRTPIPAEEWHGLPTQSIRGAQRAVVAAVLRDRDIDAMNAVLPGSSTGASGRNVVNYYATTEQGALGTSRTHGLLVAPQDPDSVDAIYFPLVEPIPEDGAKISWSLPKAWGLPALWYAYPDSAGRIYSEGLIEDFEL